MDEMFIIGSYFAFIIFLGSKNYNFYRKSYNFYTFAVSEMSDFVPKSVLYREIALFSSPAPTTTADPRFIKLTEMSFVRKEIPKSPKFSTV